MGGLFHLFNHSIFKSLLFLNSGAVEYATGTRNLQEMGGLSQKMPATTSTNLIASMSIAGIPPFNGFWSKLIIIIAAVQAQRYGYAFWAVLASILTLASFMKVMKYAYYGKLKEKLVKIKEVPVFMKLGMIFLALICVGGGLLLVPEVSKFFLKSATDILTEGTSYATVVFKGVLQ
jgi:multicomponent Na+:H+ antiporter subunit D